MTESMAGSEPADVADWIGRYERAWGSNDEADIRALFTDDAEYRTAPFRPPAVGIDAIVDTWLEHRDDGGWSFRWHTIARDGDTVFVQGETDYEGEPDFSNLWVIRLEGDRASSFTEWFMERPEGS